MSYTGGFTSEQKNKQEVKSMKKLLVLLSAILLIFAIGCSNDNPAPESSGSNAPGDDVVNPGEFTTVSTEELVSIISENIIPAMSVFENMPDEFSSNTSETRQNYYIVNDPAQPELILVATGVYVSNADNSGYDEVKLTENYSGEYLKAGDVITWKYGVNGEPEGTFVGDNAITSEQNNEYYSFIDSVMIMPSAINATSSFSGYELEGETYSGNSEFKVEFGDSDISAIMSVTVDPEISGVKSFGLSAYSDMSLMELSTALGDLSGLQNPDDMGAVMEAVSGILEEYGSSFEVYFAYNDTTYNVPVEQLIEIISSVLGSLTQPENPAA